MADPREARRRRLRGRFLIALGEHGIVARAARQARGSRRLFYDWREKDAAFAAAWDKALTLGLAAMEDAAMTRALDGAKRIVWYRGKPVGTERRPSDALLMFMLRNRLPERYGWGPGGKAAIWARAELSGRDARDGGRDARGGGGNGDAPENLTPAQTDRRIKELLTKAGVGLVPIADAPTDMLERGFRDSLLGPSPDVLARAPGVYESGP